MKKTVAYCPTSLSFIFKICPHKDLLKMGSVGIGCTINKEVAVKTEPASCTKIFFNDRKINFPTVKYACQQLAQEPIQINITSPLPLGYGFGISAASTLACLFAINKQLELKKRRRQLVKIAHCAEIVNKTGLGSVTTQVIGGFLLKNFPGIQPAFTKLPFEGKTIYATIIDKLETPSILKDKKVLKCVNKAADHALQKIKELKSPSLEEIFDISLEFCQKSTLLSDKKVIYVIDKIKKEGGHATMAILGKVVLSDVKPKLNNGYRIKELRVINDGVK